MLTHIPEMNSTMSMPSFSYAEGDFMPDAMHHIAQQPHVDDMIMAELLTAYTNENWDYFAEVSEITNPSACEPLPTIDPSLLVISPDKTEDTEMHDAILSDITSDESSRESSPLSEKMERPEFTDSQSSSLRTKKCPKSSSSSVNNEESPTVLIHTPPTSVTASQSSSLEGHASPAVFDTYPIPVSSESQSMDRNSYISEVPYPTPPPSQQSWHQQAYRQNYFAQQYYHHHHPIYAQSFYPPGAAPPFSPPMMATAPHPMGYNILPFAPFPPQTSMAQFPPQFQYHSQTMRPMPYPMYPQQQPPQPQPQQQPYSGPRALPPQQAHPQPAAPKRVFEFVNATVPEGFVANPNNHGRWQVDSNGKRQYLNAPAAKRQCVRNG
ncbi:uncharacterized protein N7483_004509 [Penicillium malachiteum]|uniref:uncharacterized protein n=1 Tax=Penicillium malachiteum TaxID=1324776 RepID=UPI0025495CBC|nr:uncharacterized protein N7483_004509 [Penicillium malachiteum]KAJ5730001.1 hypothetical protein N7483_004509 [Penicillium malachiteum]